MQVQNEETIEELNCSVCMSIFQYPVTIECGHTFCRYCILNSLRSKNSCPMCRKNLTYLNQRPQEDQTISKIIESYKLGRRRQKQETQDKRTQKGLDHSENFLLLDIRTSQLLLPFTSVKATFELQSSTLLGRLDKFVARQETPFNRFGVIAKITFLNQLRYNLYECTLEGKNFCQIQEQWVDKNTDNNQEFFFRSCQAKFIYEDYDFESQKFKPFYDRFSKIHEKKLLDKVYRVVSHEKLFSKKDTVAAYYSIMKILAVPNEEKYKIITTFDKELRTDFLEKFFQGLAEKEKTHKSSDYRSFLAVDSEKSLFFQGIAVLLIFFILIFFFAATESETKNKIESL